MKRSHLLLAAFSCWAVTTQTCFAKATINLTVINKTGQTFVAHGMSGTGTTFTPTDVNIPNNGQQFFVLTDQNTDNTSDMSGAIRNTSNQSKSISFRYISTEKEVGIYAGTYVCTMIQPVGTESGNATVTVTNSGSGC